MEPADKLTVIFLPVLYNDTTITKYTIIHNKFIVNPSLSNMGEMVCSTLRQPPSLSIFFSSCLFLHFVFFVEYYFTSPYQFSVQYNTTDETKK